jgi:uncharacterized protein (TIGR03435 family)
MIRRLLCATLALGSGLAMLSADVFSGTWKLMSLTLLVTAAIVGAVIAHAQTPAPAAGRAFDIVSVRPAEPGEQGGITRPVNGTMRVNRAPLRRIIHFAFDIDPERHDPPVTGGPAWVDTDLFVIDARGPMDLSLADGRLMMQSLLRDRFKLQTRTERRELPIYALMLARADRTLGPGLRRSSIDCAAYSDVLARTGRLAAARAVGPAECELASGGRLGGGRLFIKGATKIRDMLIPLNRSPDVDRRIVDRTGLSETFDVDFVWAPAQSGAFGPTGDDVVSIFTALREQLGLKLEPAREPGDIVTVELVERPTPN